MLDIPLEIVGSLFTLIFNWIHQLIVNVLSGNSHIRIRTKKLSPSLIWTRKPKCNICEYPECMNVEFGLASHKMKYFFYFWPFVTLNEVYWKTIECDVQAHRVFRVHPIGWNEFLGNNKIGREFHCVTPFSQKCFTYYYFSPKNSSSSKHLRSKFGTAMDWMVAYCIS